MSREVSDSVAKSVGEVAQALGAKEIHINVPIVCDRCKNVDREAHPYNVKDRDGKLWRHLCNECFDEAGCSYRHGELKIFLVDDGEQHWIAAPSSESAQNYAVAMWSVDEESIRSVDVVADDFIFALKYDGAPTGERVPAEPVLDEYGDWYCTATAEQWANVLNHGDLLCSTVSE